MPNGFDADELVIAGTGHIYVGAVGTTLPTDESTAVNAAFHDLGYTSEDGVTFRDTKTIRDSRVWQSFYPVRRSVTERTGEAEFALKQFNSDTIRLAFGGGEVTEPTNNKFKYTPPDPDEVDSRAMVIDFADGSELWRIVIPVGIATGNAEMKLTRTEDAMLPITFGITAETGSSPFLMYTNSDAFVLAS